MDISKSYFIDSPAERVWAALTQPDVIDSWGGGPSVMAPEPGFEFTLWGGDIHGTVLEVDAGRLLVEEWYSGDWSAPSIARFVLRAEPDGGTRLALLHTGVPEAEAADIDAGWDDYYLGPLQSMLESETA
jgi:uncharacterized protein YndB with AHSA1/START domain